jgi:hypothetical protein
MPNKTTPPRHSNNEIEKYCQLLCEKNKTLAEWNVRLQSQLTSTLLNHQQESESFLKRKSQDISSLTTELATHKKKLQQTERTHHSLEQANKKVKKDNQDLVKLLQEAKENVKERQQEISSLRQEHKEQMEAKAKLEFQRGVRKGIQKATKNTIVLPDNLTQSTLAKLITEAFLKVDGTKPPHECAGIAAAAVWNMYDGQAKAYLAQWSTDIIRQKNPYRQAEEIAKVMDMSPGQLNLSGYMELRKGLEIKNKKGKIPRGKGWLCSEHYVKSAQYAIEKEAMQHIPFAMLPSAEVDGFQFDYEKALLYLNDHVFCLKNAASDPTQPRILWAFTVDGVRVSANVTLIIAGIKCLDPRAIDPKTGVFISLVQSPDKCFPLKVLVCKDNKTTYQEYLADFFAYFKDLENKPVGEYPPGTFKSVSPQDGSSLWKALDRGGACKNKKEFCPYCACTSDQCVQPRSFPCESCVLIGRKDCYHWDVGDEATYARLQSSLDQLKSTFPFLAGDEDLLAKVRMRYAPQEVVKDITNIEFSPTNQSETNRFSKKVNDELKLLGLPSLGSLSQRRARLLAALEACERFKESVIGHEAAKYPGAMTMVRQAIPCILHLENRCGEKIIKMLLMDSIQLTTKLGREEVELLKKVEDVVNTRILGQQGRESNWKVPTDKNDKNRIVISDLTMPNPAVRKFLEKMHLITSVLFDMDDDEQRARKEAWDGCRTLWLNLMEMVRKKEDFTDAEIDTLQAKGDEFIETWLLLLPGDMGMTNYFHIIAAGHLKYYLKEWRNLYRYSQQGWEGMNSVVKSLLHKRSQRGGHGGKTGERNSKAKPIARWSLRRMFFFSGDYKRKVSYKRFEG